MHCSHIVQAPLFLCCSALFSSHERRSVVYGFLGSFGVRAGQRRLVALAALVGGGDWECRVLAAASGFRGVPLSALCAEHMCPQEGGKAPPPLLPEPAALGAVDAFIR